MKWLPIDTAPRDGTRIWLLGANGNLDVGSWCAYSELVDAAYRKANGIPADEDGEFSTDHGEGPHTHWSPLEAQAIEMDEQKMKIKEWKPSDPAERAGLAQEREKCRRHLEMAEGVVFKETLASSRGMSFMLMPDSHHTDEDIEQAGDYLRTHRDVEDLYFVRIEPPVHA